MAKLLSLSGETIQKMITALRKLDPTLDISDLATRIATEISLVPDETEDIFHMLLTLYVVRSTQGYSLVEFVDALCSAIESLDQPEFKPIDTDWSRFKKDLADILSLDQSLGLSAKAVEVQQEYQHIFCNARILTDLRPVFKDEVADVPLAAVIVHLLRISYHKGELSEQLYVAMDRKDLEDLQKLIQRALTKQGSLRALADKSGLRCLDIGSHGKK